jgi:hypothetical protein
MAAMTTSCLLAQYQIVAIFRPATRIRSKQNQVNSQYQAKSFHGFNLRIKKAKIL